MRLALVVSLLLLTAAPAHAQIYAAVLPSSRAVQVGTPATAFATIINAGSTTATGCRIAPATTIPATFSYQTTDPATNQLTGTANTPVDIPAGGSQSFVFGVTPTSSTDQELQLNFVCNNRPSAPVVVGVNTLEFFACVDRTSDVIAVVATPTQDGTIVVPSNGQMAAFSVAATNIGASESDSPCGGLPLVGGEPFRITRYSAVAESSAPVTLSVCQTNASGQCVGPGSGVHLPTGAVRTFSVFVTANAAIPFDPATARVRVSFRENQTVTSIFQPPKHVSLDRGSTSVAVRTQP